MWADRIATGLPMGPALQKPWIILYNLVETILVVNLLWMTAENGQFDEVDGTEESEEVTSLCNYLVFNSPDQLLLNFTSCSVRILAEIYQVSELMRLFLFMPFACDI